MASNDEVSEFLVFYKLAKYDAGLREAGVESLGDLKDLGDDDINDLCEEASMPNLHKKKFIKAVKAVQNASYPPPPEPQIDYGAQVDAFLTQYKLIKYSAALKANGLNKLESVKSMSDEDIKGLAGESKLGVLHKKKFLAACNDYKNGAYTTEAEKPPSYNEAVPQATTPQQATVVVQQPVVVAQQPQVVIAAQPVQPQVVIAAQPQVVVAQPQVAVTATIPTATVVVQPQANYTGVTVTSVIGADGAKKLKGFGRTLGKWGKKAKAAAAKQMELEKQRAAAREAQAAALREQRRLERIEREKRQHEQALATAAMLASQPQVVYAQPQAQVVVAQPQQVGIGLSVGGIGMSVGGIGMSVGVPVVQPVVQPVVHYGVQPSVNVVTTNETCPKCRGHGWVHNSSMNHDKDKDSKCFFCEDCSGCDGMGYIQGTHTDVVQHGLFGSTIVSHSGGIQTCPKCRGHGWVHDSSMNHDKDSDERCFFCEDCSTCGSSGRL